MNKLLTITILSIFAMSALGGSFFVHDPNEEAEIEVQDPSSNSTLTETELGEEADLGAEEPAPENDFQAEVLKAHNPFRSELDIEPLTYNTELEASSRKWANTLASQNSMSHSKGRNRIGENLAMGTKGAYDTARLIELWTNEKKYFKNREWPNVSTTGNWKDVAHYSQIVWRNTKEVGCALADNNKNTFIVCQYKPAGNWVGDLAY